VTSHGRKTFLELTVDRPANGGSAVGRDEDGRTVFCDGALAGERVRVAIHTEKKRFARGDVVEVLEASPGRIEPACRSRHAGCGGCDLAHASQQAQLDIKAQVVRDALIRIGRLDPDVVDDALGRGRHDHGAIPHRYRTTVRVALDGDRAAYRMSDSHSLVAPTECLVVHERLEALMLDGRFDATSGPEVVLRVSNATGERIALVDGIAGSTQVPDDVRVVSRADLANGAQVSLIERAAGRDWHVSAGSFFQAGPDVASALVLAVDAAAGDVSGSTLVDAYSGIGLFAGTVGARAESVIAVEHSGSSIVDARMNLADIGAEIVESSVETWSGGAADIVIADPARAGLGAGGVKSLARCNASRFVLVACDTGSLGRDVGLLGEHGYQIESVQVVDAFHDTSHVETIVALSR
jgi:tRNA/tmRNA/rRNA uracil-C5-methylase (TrmA/RlmC/RlmD family)